MAGARFGQATIERAERILLGAALGTGPFAAVKSPVAFCKVSTRIHPTTDSDIRSEVWLPDEWNGKLLGVGGGGLSGGLATAPLSLRIPLQKGYVGTASDVGHDANDSGQWALGHPEKLKDYAYRGNHLTAVLAKAVIRWFYSAPAQQAYFQGCSNGGRDALMEVSRFPNDYDGVIAGAPAASWTPLMTSFLFNHNALFGAPGAAGLAVKLPLIEAALVKQCDALDGVVENPRRCVFDPAPLQCKDGSSAQCLTRASWRPFKSSMQVPGRARGRS